METNIEVLPGQTFIFRDDHILCGGVWIQFYIFDLIAEGFYASKNVVDLKTTPYSMAATLDDDSATLPILNGMTFTKEQVFAIQRAIIELKPNA